jgi:hypothetical protein
MVKTLRAAPRSAVEWRDRYRELREFYDVAAGRRCGLPQRAQRSPVRGDRQRAL